ncbi:hypothetical protein INF35_05785 [Subdoligranulum sp. DSM 109015]|uniref:Uncharacterized protein n=1 Tax=Gemmiger gallinarum TaxID=2779354 RepID=A0ABR9R2X8_9FIRM|nr:hypothetical protein [Gemmiger gallinarum]MBE5037287.1 hypothetical protein [Gemmiger gallinarum]
MGIRIIDANFIVKVAEHAWDEWNLAMATQDTNRGVNKVLRRQELCKAVKAVADDAPTIDPETLPVVLDLRKQLEQVTAERDAAVKELEEVTKSVDDLAEFVDSEIHPSVDYGLYLALRENVDAVAMFQHESEWRGPVAENATAGNGGQSDD